MTDESRALAAHDDMAEEPRDLTSRPALARPIEYAILAVGSLLCLFLFLLYGKLDFIMNTQQDGVERGYKNRAAACNLIVAHGLPPTDECKEPVIQPYLDPRITVGSATSAVESVRARELLCVVVMQQNQRLDEAARLAIPPSLCPE